MHSAPRPVFTSRRTTLAAILAVVLLAGSMLVLASRAEAAPDKAPLGEWINDEREARGLSTLSVDDGTSAQCAAEKLDTENEHPEGCDWDGGWAEVSAWSVNFAMGSTIVGWMQSNVHRETLMSPSADSMRLGLACRDDGYMFMVVQLQNDDGDFEFPASDPEPVVTTEDAGSNCIEEPDLVSASDPETASDDASEAGEPDPAVMQPASDEPSDASEAPGSPQTGELAEAAPTVSATMLVAGLLLIAAGALALPLRRRRND